MLATQLGVINLVMRSPEDDKSVGIAQARPTDLYGTAAKNYRDEDSPGENTPSVEPAPVKAVNPLPPVIAAKPRETWTIRTLKPGTVDEVVFEAEEGKSASAADRSWKVMSGVPSAKDEVKSPELPAASLSLPSGEGTPKKGTVREVAKGDQKKN